MSIEKISITLAAIIASSDSLKLRGLAFALYYMSKELYIFGYVCNLFIHAHQSKAIVVNKLLVMHLNDIEEINFELKDNVRES